VAYKKTLAAGLWLLLLAVLALLAIALHRTLHGTKEDEQNYLLLGMLVAPALPVLYLRTRLRVAAASAVAACGLWFALAWGFFYYMDNHGSLPAEPCESTRVDFDEMECRGHYGFENDLRVSQLGIVGLLGTLLGLGGAVVANGRLSRGRQELKARAPDANDTVRSRDGFRT
jgi:hypothetical protein